MKQALKTILLLVIAMLICIGAAKNRRAITYVEKAKGVDSLEIREGLLSHTAQKIKYKRKGKVCAVIELSEPVKVAQAEQEEEWGYFQFPTIAKTDNGTLVVSWQMKADSHTAYGQKSDRKYAPMISKDNGKTWKPQTKDIFAIGGNYHVQLDNGDIIEIYTPTSRNLRKYSGEVKEIGKVGNKTFYLKDSLPKDLQRLYFNYWDKAHKNTPIYATLNDPGVLRYSIDSLMPIVWWGSIKQLSDKSLVAGVYPGDYYDENTKEIKHGISFYQSVDTGRTWNILGKIPFEKDVIIAQRGGEEFSEPAFEVLNDSTFICIMRTGSKSPMYRSFSNDKGRTWSKAEPFTPNGVRPWLLQLKNGVLVLVSGRPGVQVRFSLDGSGKHWTDPIDMIPFMHNDGSYSISTTCGYASIVEAGNDSFYMVYSDFTTRNILGQHRKSIWFRKITVKQ